MSLKQEKVLKELPKNNWNMHQSMLNAGYSEQSARSGSQYQALRNFTQRKGFWTEESIRREIKKALRDFKKEKDNSNRARMLELSSKILGMQIDKSINKTDTTLKIEEQKDLLQRFAIQ